MLRHKYMAACAVVKIYFNILSAYEFGFIEPMMDW